MTCCVIETKTESLYKTFIIGIIIDNDDSRSYQRKQEVKTDMPAPMPTIIPEDLQDKMTPAQWELAAPCFAKSKGATRLRASRPAKAKGSTQYIWRNVAFIVSTNPQHYCMPVGADFYINDEEFAHRTDKYIPKLVTPTCQQTVDSWDEKTWNMMHKSEQRRNYIKQELDPIVDLITNSIPKSQWRGAHRWHKAIHG